MDDFADAIALAARQVSAGVVVVAIVGELDMATTPRVEEYVRLRFGDASRALVLDLSGVTFFGSTAITMLLDLHARCESAGTPLRLVATTRVVLYPLELTGLTRHFTLFGAVDEAS